MPQRYAFADESDWNDGPFCTHAGWIASDPVWQRFEKEWSRVLAKKGLQEEGFHSTDFFNRKAPYSVRDESRNPYKGWTDEEATQFIEELSSVIVDHKLTALGCAVDVRAFLALTLSERRYLTGAHWHVEKKRFIGLGLPKYAYHLSVWGLIIHALENTREGDKVNFLFDRHRELQNRIKAYYDDLRAGPLLQEQHRKKLGTMNFDHGQGPKPEGLQAADLYAYLWSSHFRLGASTDTERSRLLIKLTNKKTKLPVFDGGQLENILSKSPNRDEFNAVENNRHQQRPLKEP